MSGILLTGALAFEVYLLLNDVTFLKTIEPKKNEPVAPPIAELVRKQNTVRTQEQGELVWDDTKDGQTLRRRETVLTLDRSKAEIAFLDGTGLVLDENSLIQLEKNPSDNSLGTQKIVVRLLRGTLHKREPRKRPDLLRKFGEQAPEFEVQLGATRVELDPASELTIVATPENPAGNKVIVQSGEVQVAAPQGTVQVKQGEEVTLPASATGAARAVSADSSSSGAPIIAAQRTPFSLVGPRSGESFVVEPSGQVKFRWNADRLTAAGQPMVLEVSQDPEFKGKVTRVKIPATEPPLEYLEAKTRIPMTDQPALWYWRVQTVGSAAPRVSDVEHFWAQPHVGPRLKFPADRVVAKGGMPVEFSWVPADEASGYELDIREFKMIPLVDAVTQVEGLAPGTYHWRVRVKSRDGGVSPWSETRVLSVRDPAATDVPPPPAELEDAVIQPADGSAAPPAQAAPAQQQAPVQPAPAQPAPRHSSIWDWLLAPAYGGERAHHVAARAPSSFHEPTWTVKLRWKPVTGIDHYRIQVGRERSFKHILTETDVTKPEYHWTYQVGMENTKGRVFYRVASISPHGTLGPYSQPKPIQIPDRILKKVDSRVAMGRGAAETYSAIEEPTLGIPTDAADKGDLDTLSAKPSEPYHLLKPEETTPITPAESAKVDERIDERIAERAKAGPEVPKLGASLTPPISQDAQSGSYAPGTWPGAKPEEPQQMSLAPGSSGVPSAGPAKAGANAAAGQSTAEASLSRHLWRWSAGLDTGIGNVHQATGDGSLSSVSTQGPFLQQKLLASAELTRLVKAAPNAPEETDRWTAQLQASFASFHKPDASRTTIQPDVKAFNLKLDVLRWDWGTTAHAFEPWNIALGVTLDREYRWVKLSPQVLDPQGALGVGPALLAVRKFEGKGILFGLMETGVELSAPLTGIVLSGGYGLEGNVWGEWNLASFTESWIGLRAEADGAYLLWSDPSGTSTLTWATGLAAAYHFDGPAR